MFSWFLHSTACPIVRKPHTQQLCQQPHSGGAISGHLECTLSAILQGLMTMLGDLAVWTHHSGVHQHLTNTGKLFTKQNTKSSCLQQFPLVGLNYQTTSPIGFMQMNGSMLAPTRFNILVLCITCAFRGPSVFPCLQQRQSAIFTTRLDDNYDAYEKDIAMVSFFFKKNTVFEYKR